MFSHYYYQLDIAYYRSAFHETCFLRDFQKYRNDIGRWIDISNLQ